MFPYDFRSEIEKDLDNALEDHKNGDCREDCPWCREEKREREIYEDNKKAKAAADAFNPFLKFETAANLKAAQKILDDFEVALSHLNKPE